MKLKRLLKKYNRICKKASAIHDEILERYEDTDTIKGNKYNIKWSNRTRNQKTPYDIIYADFNKKSEV